MATLIFVAGIEQPFAVEEPKPEILTLLKRNTTGWVYLTPWGLPDDEATDALRLTVKASKVVALKELADPETDTHEAESGACTCGPNEACSECPEGQ